MTEHAITITTRERAEWLPVEAPGPLGAGEVRGATVATLVSPGTELSMNYRKADGDFPTTPGYAAVFRVEETGNRCSGVEAGTLALCMGPHQSYQQVEAEHVIPIPHELAPSEAVLARLMGVTMTTLKTTRARPGDIVVITGAGPIGFLGAHLFRIAGYDVHVVDPDGERRGFAETSGMENVAASVADLEVGKTVALAIDCSGNEQAVLDGARAVRKGGEVVLVGVPWHKRTDNTAHEILHTVFFNYLVLRSGWEWELPLHAENFRPHSILDGFRLALRWLAEDRIPTKGLIAVHSPKGAQAVYQALLHGTAEGLFQVFDWRQGTRTGERH